jgi:hypothetical protein
MKTFVSPLYIQTNHYTNEKIACALLAANEKGIFFKINNDKIDFAAKLSPDNIKLLVKNAFELIGNKVEATNFKLSAKQTSLFEIENNFKKDYIEYLSKYASGVIQFNAPKPFDIELNEDTFENLFQKFIGKEVMPPEIDKSFISSIKKSLHKPQLKEKADINYQLNPTIFNGLLKKALVSMATTNGSLELYQAVDFNNSEISIAHKLYELMAIKSSVSEYAKKELKLKTSTKLVAVKPSNSAAQKSLFDTFYKNNIKQGDIELIDPPKFDKSVDSIINTNHKKLSELVHV